MNKLKDVKLITEETKKGPDGYSLNIQHDYITLKTPYGNYTTSYGGDKVSGLTTSLPNLLKRLHDYTGAKSAELGNYGLAMEDLMNNFTTVIPEVLTLGNTGKFEVGNIVKFSEPLFIKKYPGEYTVVEVKKTTVTLRIGTSKINVPSYAVTYTSKNGVVDVPTKVTKGGKATFIEEYTNKYPGEFDVLDVDGSKYAILMMNGKKTRVPSNMIKGVKESVEFSDKKDWEDMQEDLDFKYWAAFRKMSKAGIEQMREDYKVIRRNALRKLNDELNAEGKPGQLLNMDVSDQSLYDYVPKELREKFFKYSRMLDYDMGFVPKNFLTIKEGKTGPMSYDELCDVINNYLISIKKKWHKKPIKFSDISDAVNYDDMLDFIDDAIDIERFVDALDVLQIYKLSDKCELNIHTDDLYLGYVDKDNAYIVISETYPRYVVKLTGYKLNAETN